MSKPPYHLHHAPGKVETAADKAASELDKLIAKKKADDKKQKKEGPSFTDVFTLMPLILGEMSEVVGIAKNLFETAVKHVPTDHIVDLITNTSQHWPKLVNPHNVSIDSSFEGIGGAFVDGLVGKMITDAQPSKGGSDQAALNTIRRVVGFSFVYMFASMGLVTVSKLFLKDRIPDALGELPGRISESVGIDFMLGMIFNEIFEMATMKPLEEIINRKVRPSRIDFRVIKSMLKQHVLEEGEYKKQMVDLGYEDGDIELIKKLDKHALGVSDLQQAHLLGVTIPGGFGGYMKSLGYDDDDIELLQTIYIDKAQTSAGASYKAAAREAYASDHITEGQFEAILREIKLPDESIKLEIAAANLLKDVGKLHVSISILKTAYLEKEMDEGAVIQQLRDHGYNESDANLIVRTWASPHTVKRGHIPVSRILYYYAHSVISRGDAFDMLTALGYREQEANLLLDHPETKLGSGSHQFSVGVLKDAYKDKLISFSDYVSRRVADNATQEEATLEAQVIDYSLDPSHKRAGSAKLLSMGTLHQMIKYQVVSPGFAQKYLVRSGYSESDAGLIITLWTGTGSEGGGVGEPVGVVVPPSSFNPTNPVPPTPQPPSFVTPLPINPTPTPSNSRPPNSMRG